MRSLLLVLISGCLSAAAGGQVLTQLDSRVSINLPAGAEPNSSAGKPLWFFPFDDSSHVSGMVMIIDGREFDLDSATIARNYNDPAFIKSLINGMFQGASGITEVARKKISGPHFKGYEIELKNSILSEQYPYTQLFVRVNFAGHMVYILGVYALEGADPSPFKDKFYNSFHIR